MVPERRRQNMTTAAHIRSLGPAPFRYLELVGPTDAVYLKNSDPFTGIEAPHDRCACCNKRISWRVIVGDADGGRHVMGRTCAQKLDDLKLIEFREQELKVKRAFVKRYLYMTPDFVAWCRKQPHPKGWENKSLFDYLAWLGNKPSRAFKPLLMAVKAFGAGDDADEVFAVEKKRQQRQRARKHARFAWTIREYLKNHPLRGTPFAPLEDLDDCTTLLKRTREALERKHGPMPEPLDANAMSDEELWAEADKRKWIHRGRFLG